MLLSSFCSDRYSGFVCGKNVQVDRNIYASCIPSVSGDGFNVIL